jgi:uncharacterized damage-inducible protein DinB
MSVSLEVLRDHIEYTAWATRRLVEAAAQLSPEELTRDFQTGDRTVIDTLVHVFGADRIWLARIEGAPSPGVPAGAERDLARLQTAFPELHGKWRQWASSLTANSPDTQIAYSDLKGRQWKQPLWQIILHVVNHGTHHRGQVSGFIRSLGHTPPTIDLSFYHRGQT